MKNLFYTIILAFILSMNAGAATIAIDYSQTESDYNSISESEMVAAFAFRTGGSSTWELNSGDNLNSLADPENVSWTKNGEQGFNLLYTGSGNATLSISEVGGSVITTTTEPLSWFNEVWITLDVNSNGHLLSLTNSVLDSDPVNDVIADWNGNRFSVIKITLDNTSGDVDPLNFASVLSTDTTQLGLGVGNDFRGEVVFRQVIPEPSSFILLLVSFPTLFLLRKKQTKPHGSIP